MDIDDIFIAYIDFMKRHTLIGWFATPVSKAVLAYTTWSIKRHVNKLVKMGLTKTQIHYKIDKRIREFEDEKRP